AYFIFILTTTQLPKTTRYGVPNTLLWIKDLFNLNWGLLKVNHPSQYHFMIQEFYSNVKIPFTGEEASYKPYQFSLLRRMKDDVMYDIGMVEHLQITYEKWSFKLDFRTVLLFFDSVIDKIIELIEAQLDSVGDVSAMFLVGGFIPISPELSILNGACKYGLDMEVIKTRVLKWTYGVKNHRDW
ncbi:15239_t:CDS:2, partial [Funneliformis caledonium]